MRTLQLLPSILLLFALAIGCGSNQTLRVTSIQLGRSLNADNSVGNFTTTFAPNDTISI